MVRQVAKIVAVLVLAASVFVGTRYRHAIWSTVTKTKGGPAQTMPWTPYPADGRPLVRLAVAGDTGDSGIQLDAVGLAMGVLAEDDPYDELLLLGDCVYPSGDASRIDALVFQPFSPVLDKGTELLAVLGNHDVMKGQGDAELAKMGIPGRWWSVERDGLFLVGLDSTEYTNATQRRWLERTLASPAARAAKWRVVAFHHPPYSAGYQGSNEGVREAWAPLFERYGVQLVLSGHDHDYQRSKPINGVTYVVSGGGSGIRRTGTASFTAVSFAWHHFLDVAVFEDRLVVRAVNAERRVADEFTLR